MGIWDAMEKLSELVDDSDPDVSVFRFLQLRSLRARSSRLCASFSSPRSISVALATLVSDNVTGRFYPPHLRPGRDFDLTCFLLTLLDDRLSDRALVANRGGHSTRWETGMDASHRTRSRPGKTSLLLWISGPVGRRWGHFCRGVQVFEQDHLSRHVREQPGLQGPRLLDRVRGVQATLRIGQRSIELGT